MLRIRKLCFLTWKKFERNLVYAYSCKLEGPQVNQTARGNAKFAGMSSFQQLWCRQADWTLSHTHGWQNLRILCSWKCFFLRSNLLDTRASWALKYRLQAINFKPIHSQLWNVWTNQVHMLNGANTDINLNQKFSWGRGSCIKRFSTVTPSYLDWSM